MNAVVNSLATDPKHKKETYGEKWLRLYADDVALFAKCSLKDLDEIYDALKVAGDAINSIYNRPAVDVEGRAGTYIGKLSEKIDEKRAALLEHVKRRKPDTADEYQAYCRIILTFQTDCGAELDEIVLMTQHLTGKNPELVGRA